ncbi:MAG TPA: helix-turn-helix transcriptional regulator [Luteimonas sp.]|nr:helix-turn-helix transcriptional regulator [Luteimonas sp.]
MDENTPTEAVEALVKAGWSEARIAKEAQTSQPTIHRVKNGHANVTFGLGLRLIRLAQGLPAANDDAGPPEGDGAGEGAG